MRRPVMVAIVVVGATMIYGLYVLGYEVGSLQRTLAERQDQLAETRRTTKTLRAEWAYAVRPDNLRVMARKYLKLVPIQPEQVISDLGDLPAGPTLDPFADFLPRPRPKPAVLRD